MPAFFKLTKNRQFNYIPRYYNQREDEMKKRKERISRELQKEEGIETDDRIPLIKGQIKSHYRQYSKTHKKQFNIRLLAILAVLLFLAYYLILK